MAPALVAAIPAVAAVGGAALQADAAAQQQEEAKRQEQNAMYGRYGEKLSNISEAFGTGAQNKSTAEADALKTLLRGF
jgi:hypothetical protein